MKAPGNDVGTEASGNDVSAATERLQAQVRTIGPHFRTVLITGERGARKEEVARALHAASPAAGAPFVLCDAGWMEASRKVDAGRDDDRAYTELVRASRGGTIFFPELGLFSRAAQADLLQMLNRLGEEQGTRVRVVASVSGDLQAMVAGGMLRSDLRERIGVIEMAVAPLRERIEDMAAVAGRILERAAVHLQETPKISVGALRELQRRGWPGNDRELESALRIATLASGGGLIEPHHLPEASTQGDIRTVAATTAIPVSSAKLQDVVDAHVQEVLRRCEGNKLKAAETLGISRSTLYRMLDVMATNVS